MPCVAEGIAGHEHDRIPVDRWQTEGVRAFVDLDVRDRVGMFCTVLQNRSNRIADLNMLQHF